MGKKVQEKTLKERLILILVVSILGFIMIMGLFFWYKSFAYYTHSIYTYQVDEITDHSDSATRQMIVSHERLKRYYETVVENHSSSDIVVDIYDNLDINNSAPIESNLLISSGEKYIFDSYGYAYKVIIRGSDITEDNILVEASTISYLKKYRQSVIVTMIIGIVMVAIWDMLILFVPGVVINYGTKINIGITLFSSIGSILSCILFYRGYYESNLCFIALFCTVLALSMKNRENYDGQKRKIVTIDEIYFTAGTISLFLSCLMMCSMYNSTETSPFYIFNAKNKMSLLDYLITAVVFLLLFIIISRIFLKKQKVVSFIKFYCAGKELIVCVPAVTVAFLVQQSELGLAGSVINSVSCLIITGILFYLLLKLRNRESKLWPIYILYIFAILITTSSTMVINYFHEGNETSGYVHHIGWYYRSLYYMANNIPYSNSGYGIYGHYQIFYKLPMEIFGANLLTVGIVTGIVGGLTSFFAVGIIHMLTRSNLLRAIGVIAVVNILCYQLYIAIVPHRLIFPMMMLFFIVYLRKIKCRWFHIVLGFIIGLLSVVWNTEVGAVVLLTWIVFLILKALGGIDNLLDRFMKKILITLGIMLIAAVMIVGTIIYGFNTSQSTFLSNNLGVLMNVGYMFSAHFNFIRWTNSPWIYIMMMYFVMSAYGISRMGLLSADRDQEQNMPAVISIAVMGMGLMVYFISRPEDYSIIVLPAIFLTIMLLDKYYQEKSMDKRMLSIFFLLGICCILIRTGDVMEGVWNRVVGHQQLNYNLLLEDLDLFSIEVPEGSYALDDGLTEIYMCLGWEMPLENNTEYYVAAASTIVDSGKYTLVKEILFGDMHYYLYRNNNYSQ